MAADSSRSSSSADSYIGSLISLTSKSEIRYEGILYSINTEESSIGLRNVRSFGTEGRKKDGPQVPPNDKVFEYILFRGSDIKDLQVKSSPPVQPSPPIQTTPPINNDPAIIQSHYPRPASTSSSLPAAVSGSLTDLSSHTAQLGHPGSTFQGGLPLYQPGGNLGSWGPSPPPPSVNGSGLAMPMYWQGFYGPPNGLPHLHQQSLLRPPPGLSMPPSMQQPMQYSGFNASLPTGASGLPGSNLPEYPSFLSTTTSSLNLTSTSLPPSTLSLSLPPVPLPSETLHNSMPNKAPNSAIPTATLSTSLPSLSPLTASSPDVNAIVPPISNKPNAISGPAVPYPTMSQPISGPTVPYPTMSQPISGPTVPYPTMSQPISGPTVPYPTMSQPISGPTVPYPTMSQPISGPAGPYPTMSQPISGPAGPYQTISHPISGPAGPYQTMSYPISGPAGPYQTMSQPTSTTVGTSSSIHTETPIPSLVTPGQLLQSGPAAVSSSQSLQIAHKDVEVGQVSPTLSSKPPALVSTEAQPPILPLPPPTRAVQKVNGAPFQTRHSYRGRERGRETGSSRPVTKFTEDFDFMAMNEKFKKDEVWGHLGKSSKSHLKEKEADGNGSDEDDFEDENDAESSKLELKPVYNKDDFFDTLSCNALDHHDSNNGRTRFSEQMKIDTETFGDFSRYRGGRGGRGPGRGGRSRGPYYGRGYGYVGRGRGWGMPSRAS